MNVEENELRRAYGSRFARVLGRKPLERSGW